ncbi:MAG: aminoglycoside phosphotransferase family protein [Anaerolineae bacterium]|nr:aminoglycoside phosphotransferase family protein [Anaerolineae bacterium]
MVDAGQFGELQTLCRRSFPERLDQRVSQIRAMGGGRHPALAFALSWREGRTPRVERLVMRRYADAWTWWSRSDHEKAQREWEVVCWLYAQGFPVATPYAWGTAREGPYLLVGETRGRVLSLEDEADRRRYAEVAAGLLARLHSLSPPGGVRQVLPELSARQVLERAAALADACGADEVVQACGTLMAVEVEVLPLCVVHGDLDADRLRCDAQGITAVDSWENAALGDPRWDLARIALALRTQGADAQVEALYNAYPGQGGAPPEAMPYWEALSALYRWATVEWAERTEARVRLGPLDELRAAAWRALVRLEHDRSVTSQPGDAAPAG